MTDEHTQAGPVGPCDSGFALADEWEPDWSAACRRMASDPFGSGVLPRKTAELVGIAVNAACTNLNAEGTRRHIRGALAAGATRAEVLLVIKMASLLAIHSCSLGAPILLEEAAGAGAANPPRVQTPPTPFSDGMRQAGMWNEAWDPFFSLDPAWTDAFMATAADVYSGVVIDRKTAELLSTAFDASITHMYAPGTRRHIRAALEHGATVQEIMEVLKLCVVQGVQAANMALPILAEELERAARLEQAR
ncbi:MAG: carboxymuconolactone decarboxylase family protein [Proteobacteria bacterium]|nr:carboxymuconolactone decarboxylase family protein [Pseudomonadota bacterium]